MTASTLIAELLWPLLVLGAPVVVFTSIGRASWPTRERLPLTRWDWKDLCYNFRQGLRITAQHTPLGLLTDDTAAPPAPSPPPQPDPH